MRAELPVGLGVPCSEDLGWWREELGHLAQAAVVRERRTGQPSPPTPHSLPRRQGQTLTPALVETPFHTKTGRLHSCGSLRRIHQCLRRGQQGGDFNLHFTHREAEARVVKDFPGSKSVAETAELSPLIQGGTGLRLANWRLLVFQLCS